MSRITCCSDVAKFSSTTMAVAPESFELVLEFVGGVQRIGVDHHEAGAQRAEHRDGYCSTLGSMSAMRSPFLSPRLLQPGGERAAALVDLAVGERDAICT